MKWSKQSEYNQFLVERDIIGFFDAPITLKSGRISNWYVNFRTIAEDAKRLDLLTDFVVSFCREAIEQKALPVAPLCLYGVPEGATKAAIISQMKFAQSSGNYSEGSHPVPMGRAKPKEHGMAKDRYFVGAPRGGTLILEDVTTTGGSLLSTLDHLEESGVEVVGAIGFANRMEKRDDGLSVAEAISRKKSLGKNLSYLYMSSALDLLPLAAKKQNPNPKILAAVENEFKEWGVSQISF